MGRLLPSTFYISFFVFCLGLFAGDVAAQWDPTWFTCPSTTPVNCNSATLSLMVDLTSDPDARWYSCKTQRGSSIDTCCGYPQINNNERCVEIIVQLHPDAQAVVFEKPGASDNLWQIDRNHPNAPASPGSGPSGSEAYRIDCGATTYPPGQIACLTPAQIAAGQVTFTFCKPGNDEQVYRVRSIRGNISTGNLIIQQGACGGSISISPTNIDLNTLTWNSTQQSSYNNFLSSLTDTMVTVTVPNGADLSNARWVSGVPYLDYEVCGYPNGHTQCGSIDSVCGIASIAIIQPPSITATDVTVCPEDPYYVEVTHPSREIFEYWWYDGPNGTSTELTSGTMDWNWTFTTPGAKSVVFRDPSVAALGLDPNCTRDTINFNINLFPVPPASINDPGLICTDLIDGNQDYDFTTPSVSGATYAWEFREYPGGSLITTSSQREPTVQFSTCGDKQVLLTVTSADGCDSMVMRILQADSLPPDLTGCNLPNPTVECGGTAQNNANITTWHNANLTTLEAANGCVSEDCAWEVTSDFDLGNFTPGPCGAGSNSGSIVVIYTVSDGCFQSQISATYTIVDSSPPVVNDPDLDDMSFECVLEIPAPEANITLTEDCGNASFSYLEDSPAGDPCSGFQIVRSYELIDACDNRDTFYQTFTLEDDTPPSISCPGNITAEACGAEDLETLSGLPFRASDTLIDPDDFRNLSPGNPQVSDNCGILSLTYSDVQTGTCPASFVRTFVVTDSCGNTDQCSQTITVTDNTPPTVDCNLIDDLVLDCDQDYLTEIQAWVNGNISTLRSNTVDGCGDTLDITSDWDGNSVPNLSCNLSSGLPVTFTVADSCGNASTCVVDIIIQDTIPPAINCGLLPGGTLECYADLIAQIEADSLFLTNELLGIVTDDCVDDFTVDVTGIPPLDNCPNPNIPITFSVTDFCGNTSQCVITYAINNVGPTVTCPSGSTFECYIDLLQEVANDSLELLSSGVVTACNMSYTVSVGTIPTITTCPSDVTVTFTVTDSCGRSDNCTVTYSFTQIAPTISCPADITVEACGSEDLGTITGLAYSTSPVLIDSLTYVNLDPPNSTVSDNCAIDSLYYFDQQTATCPAQFTRTFVVVDSCGNSDQCTQNITITDTQPPTVDCVVSDLYLDCADDLLAEIGSWITATEMDILGSSGTTDPCGDSLEITNDWNPTNLPVFNSCDPMSNGIQIIFTVTDSCGNPSTCLGQVFLQDTVAPTVNCPSGNSGTFTCYADLISQIRSDSIDLTSEIGGIVADDCWDNFNVSVSGIPGPNNCPQPVINVTYTITDPCGNSVDCIYTYTIDNAGPTFTCPISSTFMCYLDLVAEVEADSLELYNSVVTSCGMPYVVVVRPIPTITTCPSDVAVTLVVIDSCGRSDSCTINYNFTDQPPQIVCPADLTIDGCTPTAINLPSVYAYSTDSVFIDETAFDAIDINSDASDNCGVLQVAYYDVITNASCPIIIERTWTVFDSCLATNSCVQTLTVQDTMLPLITCPQDIEADGCGLSEVAGITGGWAFSTTSVIMDETAFENNPSFPGDVSDNCGVLQVAYTDVITNASCPIVIQRTWTAYDTCLNTRSCVQTITVQDTMLPLITCPVDIEADGCGLSEVAGITGGWAFSTTSVIMDETAFEGNPSFPGDVSDNCGVLEVAYYDVVTSTSCPIVIERTWTVFDTCLNTRSCVQTITVQDTMLPLITCPVDIEADGCELGDVGSITGGWAYSPDSVFMDETAFESNPSFPGDVSDNCGVLQVAYYDVVTSTSCPIVIERTWTVFDTCLNTRTCVQMITVQDTMLPLITCPVDIEADGCELGDVGSITGGWAYSPDSVFMDETAFESNPSFPGDVSDNCGVLQVAYYDVVTSTSCPIVIERTWTVFDTCLNTRTCVQMITVQDTMLPLITCPVDIEADGCEVGDVGSITGGWAYSTDSVFMDETAFESNPSFPGDVSDNCGVLQVAYYDVVTSTSCPIVIERTWTVFDTCLNTRSCVQTITVQDTMLPLITCPVDIEADGCELGDVGSITGGWAYSPDSVFMDETAFESNPSFPGDVSDNCGVLQVAYYDVITNTSCPIEITRTWTVFDSCNNSQFCEQLITIQDTMLPTIVCPADVEADGCSTDDVLAATGWAFSTDSVFTDEVTYDATDAVSDAADNCGVLRVAYYDVITNTSCPIEITRTWTVFDSCNNSQFCEQLITIQDTMLPTIVCPADVEADGCSTDDVLAATGWAFSTDSVFTDEVTYDATDAVSDAADNCGVLRVAYYDVITNTSCPIEITRTWTVFDSCNNSQFCEQLITIQDTMLPTIVCPADVEADGCSTDDVLAATGWAFSTDSVFTDEVTYDATDAVSDAADNCGVLRVAYYDVITNTSCPIEITRTWTVFDSCNNSQFCEQLITIQDTMLPTIVCPADVEADGCSTDDVLAATGWAFSTDSVFTDEVTYDATDAVSDAADNCGVLRVAYYDVITNTSCPIEITRTWTVFDSCNNSQFCEQLITIQDTMLPTIVCPADVEADGCSTDDVLAATGWAFSTDSVFTDEVTYDATDAR